MSARWENVPAGPGLILSDRDKPGCADLRVMVLRTGGMMCGRCATRAESAIRRVPGTRKAVLEWELDRATVHYESGRIHGPGSDGGPSDETVRAWAEQLITIIGGEARARHHEHACGHVRTPPLLV